MPADQTTALLDMKERTGVFLLMGCSADRVSYESAEYGQGLLTYSLLFGMKGASLRKRIEGEYVDVMTLFRDVADRVPRLANGIGGIQMPLVSIGEGGSFDIGRLTTEDKAKIRLADKRPLVLRPRLVNTDDPDDDKLERLFERSLREASAPVGRGKQPALVYVPVADEFPGAIRVTGNYSMVDSKVTGRLTLRRDGKVIALVPIEGKADDLPAVAKELTRRIVAAP